MGESKQNGYLVSVVSSLTSTVSEGSRHFATMLLILLSLIGLATAVRTCIETNPALSVPSCTVSYSSPHLSSAYANIQQDSCIAVDSQVSDRNCGNNLKDMCYQSDGVRNYFTAFSDCLLQQCPDDNDRYRKLI